MPNEDLQWLAAERPRRHAIDPAARERARAALVRHTRSHRDRRRIGRLPVFGSAAALGVAAATALAFVFALSGTTNTPATPGSGGSVGQATQVTAPHGPVARTPLLRLADYVEDSGTPGGDATVVARTTTNGSASVTVFDLYTDDGRYFFSRTQGGLAGQVRTGHNLAGGLFAREIAAAKLADSGDVRTAAQQMADAPNPGHPIPRRQKIDAAAIAKKEAATGQHVDVSPSSLFDNWAWEDSLDAITAGSGDPGVRAGVLRILATLPDVIVDRKSVV